MGILQSVSDALLGILFPDRCVGCAAADTLLCPTCAAAMPAHPQPPRRVARGTAQPHHTLDSLAIAYTYGGVMRTAIQTLKYRRVRRMAQPLAELLYAYVQRHPLAADMLLPVPIHAQRKAARGFNQSDLLAHHLAARLRVPVATTALVKVRDTRPQVGLDRAARQSNIAAAFLWQAPHVPPARVLLVDDVVTTGATLLECASVLRAAGCREVHALVLAQSQPATDRVPA